MIWIKIWNLPWHHYSWIPGCIEHCHRRWDPYFYQNYQIVIHHFFSTRKMMGRMIHSWDTRPLGRELVSSSNEMAAIDRIFPRRDWSFHRVRLNRMFKRWSCVLGQKWGNLARSPLFFIGSRSSHEPTLVVSKFFNHALFSRILISLYYSSLTVVGPVIPSDKSFLKYLSYGIEK